VTQQLLGIHLGNEVEEVQIESEALPEAVPEAVKCEIKVKYEKSEPSGLCPLPTVELVRYFTGFYPEEEDF
jgi:hypothetical protein